MYTLPKINRKGLGIRRLKITFMFLIFGIVGAYLLATSRAASPVTSVEAEAGSASTNVSVVSDTSASAGKAVRFGSTGSSASTCTVGQVPGNGNCTASPAPTIGSKQWKVIFSDDFDGSSLNTSKWTPCFDWNYGGCTGTFNQGREYYDPAQVRLSGGVAHLVAEPSSTPETNSGCYTGTCTYKAGLISTARPRADNGSSYLFPFTYGYVEAKVKFPAVSGMFTAFWMLPTNPSYTYNTEIDIVEILGGDPKTIFMTYHYNGRNDSHNVNSSTLNNGACAVKDYSKDWVRFGVDWQPTHVAWYIDGVKCDQFNGDASTIESGPMQLILHMMVDNSWERSWGLTLPNQSTSASLDVDYVHIYQLQ